MRIILKAVAMEDIEGDDETALLARLANTPANG